MGAEKIGFLVNFFLISRHHPALAGGHIFRRIEGNDGFDRRGIWNRLCDRSCRRSAVDPPFLPSIFQYRSGQNVLEDELECDFPFGDVIERITFEMISPLKDEGLKNLKVDGIICRSEGNSKLLGREAGEQRANGLLIVDDMDAVLDLTFLPQFEGAPYLSNIFGVIRITNLREHLSWYLNNGKDSPLTVTREGFDTKHDFTKLLFECVFSKSPGQAFNFNRISQ